MKLKLFLIERKHDLEALEEYALSILDKLADRLEAILFEAIQPYWLLFFVFLGAFIVLAIGGLS